jgi:excisionase family DNA binding protein
VKSPEEHLSLREAADALGISEVSARRWVKSGRLEAYQPGRKYLIPISAVEELLQETRSPKTPSRPSPESPEEAPAEEERHTRSPHPEELKSRIAFMRRRQEKRRGDAEEAEENGVVDAADWIFDLDAADHYLENLYEVEGITEAVKAVNEGKTMTTAEVRSLCVVFDREFAALKSLTDEAKIIAQELESRISYEAIRGMSEIDAFRAEVSD